MDNWISVKDRLPSKEDYYLIYPEGKYAGVGADFWPYDDFRGHKKNTFEITSEFDDVTQVYVTHWMPLPNPPEAKNG